MTHHVSEELLNMLDKAVARELQVSIQYMWHHILTKGVRGYAVKEIFKKIAITEMKHAEKIAERLAYYGRVPTTKPNEIVLGNNLKEFLEIDRKAEEEAIDLYKQIIKKAKEEEDYTTEQLFIEILGDEEEHYDIFSSLLEES